MKPLPGDLRGVDRVAVFAPEAEAELFEQTDDEAGLSGSPIGGYFPGSAVGFNGFG